jgi:hypothetical protein
MTIRYRKISTPRKSFYILRAFSGWGAGGFFLKTSAPLSFMTYQMSLSSAGFISLDITFNERIICRIVGVLEAVFVFAAVVGVLALSAYLLLV